MQEAFLIGSFPINIRYVIDNLISWLKGLIVDVMDTLGSFYIKIDAKLLRLVEESCLALIQSWVSFEILFQ